MADERYFRITGKPGDPIDYEEVPVDPVAHPPHYTNGFGGVEVIQITEHLNFCRGNAVKYLCRAGKKGGPGKEIEDLEKAAWYVSREIERLKKERAG